MRQFVQVLSEKQDLDLFEFHISEQFISYRLSEDNTLRLTDIQLQRAFAWLQVRGLRNLRPKVETFRINNYILEI